MATKAANLKAQIVTSSAEKQHIADVVSRHVLVLRGERVLLAQQLAALYEVETRVLNQAVKRNIDRFPADFMFQLDEEDMAALRSQFVILGPQAQEALGSLRSQIVTLKPGQHAKYAPMAFTEQGVAMLSSVLRSDRAIAVNVEIMRTFVKLRGMMAAHSDLKRKLNQLEKKYDDNFRMVFDAIHQLMDEPGSKQYSRRKIGFTKE